MGALLVPAFSQDGTRGAPDIVASLETRTCFKDMLHNEYAGPNCFMDQDHLSSTATCCSSQGVKMMAFYLKDSACERRLEIQDTAAEGEERDVASMKNGNRFLQSTELCFTSVLSECYVGQNFFNNHHRAHLKHGSSICVGGARQAVLFQKEDRCP